MITVMAAALLAAACSNPSSAGTGGSPNAGASANGTIPVAYSRCMRSHGVPDFPDPNSSGQIPKEAIIQLGASTSVLQSAQRACVRLWPFQPLPQAQQRRLLSDDLKFARCMRSHGLPNFPDPSTRSDGPYFAISISKDGFDPHSSQILARARACQHVLPAGSRLPSVTVSP